MESVVRAWRPGVEGVDEVFHARFSGHAYPMHTHESWTLLIIDEGVVRYDLERSAHGAFGDRVTLLPPHVPHNGTGVTSDGFRKRVVYLDESQLGADLIGRAVDRPEIRDASLRHQIDLLHAALASPGDEFDAESRLALITRRLRRRLAGRVPVFPPKAPIADRFRQLLDASVTDRLTLDEVSRRLGAHPAHLVRAFTGRFGVSPHRYLIGRRVAIARRLLLDGLSPSRAAACSGFYDQAHLTRHFKRLVGTTPGRFLATWGNR